MLLGDVPGDHGAVTGHPDAFAGMLRQVLPASQTCPSVTGATYLLQPGSKPEVATGLGRCGQRAASVIGAR